jgi:tetratricopeptide (TPR) repeat protein
VLFLARTQMRLDNIKPALDKLDDIIAKSKDREILSGAYQSKAEYYLSVKDYDNAILNLKKAIEFSSDSEFKAQLQFIVATVTERFDTKKAAVEFEKVMDYGVSYDLEYLARFNNVKNLIANDNFAKALKLLEDMEVKYKDIVQYLGEISFLKGTYFEKRNDMKKAIAQYYYVIQNYPSTKPSSDASYRIAQYEETVKKDYLHAYMYYKFSTEQSSIGTYYIPSNNKAKVYKRYFELRSAIEGMTINTEYDTTFKRKTSLLPPENEENIEHGKEFGKPGGYSLTYESISDSLTEEKRIEDSLKTREKTVSEAKYELAELFLYDLSNPDSSEYYLINAFDNSDDYEFRAKVLFALANLYRSTDREEKSNVVLNRIIQEFPSSQFAFSSKKILNIYVEDDNLPDPADSLYSDAENNFMGKSYPDALNSFKNIIARFPDSKYSDRSLYAVGWIYENILMKPDSAYMYYFSLKQKSPESELSLFVNPKITEYETFMKKDIPDSSLNKDTLVSKDSSKSNIQNPEIKEQENKTDNSEGIQSETEKDNPSIKKEEDKIQNDEKK